MDSKERDRTIKAKHLLFAAAMIILCLWLMPLGVAADEVINLEQASIIALKNSPALAASRSEVDAAAARLTQAKSVYYPQVSASAGYDRIRTKSTGGSTSANNTDSRDNYSAELSVNQYLFDFGKTQAQVNISRQGLAASDKSHEISEQTLIRDVKLAYFEVLKNQQLVIVSNENVSLKNRQLAQSHALYNQGMRPKIDVTRAEVERSKAKLQLVNDQFGLQQSIIAFEKLLGGPPASGSYSLAEENPKTQIPATLAPLLDLAIQARPEIMRIQALIDSAQAALLSAKRGAFPNLSARGSYVNSDDTYPPESESWQVGLKIDWSFFTGFKTTGRIAESKADVNGLKSQLNNLKLSVTEEVTQAFLLVQAKKEAIKTAEVALRQAKENLSMAEGRYGAGVSDALELSDAQVLYTESRSALVQSIYEHYKALAGLEFSVGSEL